MAISRYFRPCGSHCKGVEGRCEKNFGGLKEWLYFCNNSPYTQINYQMCQSFYSFVGLGEMVVYFGIVNTHNDDDAFKAYFWQDVSIHYQQDVTMSDKIITRTVAETLKILLFALFFHPGFRVSCG